MKKLLLIFLFAISFITPNFSASPYYNPLPIVNTITQTVYITKTGTKYHLGSCHHLRQSKIKTTKSQAVNKGYSACKTCKP